MSLEMSLQPESPSEPAPAPRDESRLLRAVIDSLHESIFVKDVRGRYVLDNAAHLKFVGLTSPDELPGKTTEDFYPPELAGKYEADDAAIFTGAAPSIETEEPIVDRGGQQRWVATVKTPLVGESGKIELLVGISRDITARKLAEEKLRLANEELAAKQAELLQAMETVQKSHEELIQTQLQLIQAEKMDSVGRLAAGVAHEVKNPLAILMMGIDFLLGSALAGDPQNATVLRRMREAVMRGNAIVRGLVDFSASRQLDLQFHNFNEVLEQSLLLVRHELVASRVKATTEFAANLPPVRLDDSKLEQVFVNLLINACHAMPDGGSIIVRTYARRFDGGKEGCGTWEHGPFHDGDIVAVAELDDTGAGIPPEKLSHVFDPFFTTKPAGKGTGLGLTVVRKIVELHGGTVEIGNRQEGGVRVTVKLRAERSSDHANYKQHPDDKHR
jgi:PAS domain S-box-containing protein